eukprot:2459943-Pyramimonas_sp.AAC.1
MFRYPTAHSHAANTDAHGHGVPRPRVANVRGAAAIPLLTTEVQPMAVIVRRRTQRRRKGSGRRGGGVR